MLAPEYRPHAGEVVAVDHILALLTRRELVAVASGLIALVIFLILDQRFYNGRYGGVDFLGACVVVVIVWLTWTIWVPRQPPGQNQNKNKEGGKP